MNWIAIGAIGSLISGIVLLVAAVAALLELDRMARDRFVSATNTFFQVWESRDFQRAQSWILHDMSARTWQELVQGRAGREAQEAVIMVSTFYNRVGTLTRLRLVSPDPLLLNIGGYAVLVWHKLAPLLKDVRAKQDPLWLSDFEYLMEVAERRYEPGRPPHGEQAVLSLRPRPGARHHLESRAGLRLVNLLWRMLHRGSPPSTGG